MCSAWSYSSGQEITAHKYSNKYEYIWTWEILDINIYIYCKPFQGNELKKRHLLATNQPDISSPHSVVNGH